MRLPACAILPALLAFTLGCSDPAAPGAVAAPDLAAARPAFGFQGSVKGPGGELWLTGGGSYVSAAGDFRCTAVITQGPLQGCRPGDGASWQKLTLLLGAEFQCFENEPPAFPVTDARTAVMRAEFRLPGNGRDESFSTNMIVTDGDLDPYAPGVQNLWVEGVGCGTGQVHFN